MLGKPGGGISGGARNDSNGRSKALLPHGSTTMRGHRYAGVQRVTGALLMAFSLTNAPPMIVSAIYREPVYVPFLAGLLVTFHTGVVVWWPARRMGAQLKTRDGFLITALFWIVLGLFGSIPLHLASEAWPTWTEAAFESVSGLTTTGATTLSQGIDELPYALNFYRAELHWLGGMGIIVLAVAILPMLGVGGAQLFRAETPGPMKDAKLTPRIAGTARLLWTVYASLTAVCALVYWLLGMDPFDAICHAMSTLSTGGFSTHDASIGYFNSVAIEIAVMFFMLVGAVNFSLHFFAWRGRSLRVYWADGEFRSFVIFLAVLGALVCVPLWLAGTYSSLGDALRYGLFTLIAFATDAGFGIADPSGWPAYTPMLIVLSGFMVGCSGSTAGGVKHVRLILLFKQAMRELQRLVHPNAQFAVRLNNRVVDNDVAYAIGGFVSVYIGLTMIFTFAMMATGLDAVTAFSAVAACLNNEGPGLGEVAASVATVTPLGKWILMLAMVMGRLEVFTFLVLLTPAYWRR